MNDRSDVLLTNSLDTEKGRTLLERYSSAVRDNTINGFAREALAKFLLDLEERLKSLQYKNLEDLIRGAEAANHLSPMLTEEKQQGDKLRAEVERLLGVIRTQDAMVARKDNRIDQLEEELRTKSRTLELVVGQRNALDRQNDSLRDSNVALQEEVFNARKRLEGIQFKDPVGQATITICDPKKDLSTVLQLLPDLSSDMIIKAVGQGIIEGPLLYSTYRKIIDQTSCAGCWARL